MDVCVEKRGDIGELEEEEHKYEEDDKGEIEAESDEYNLPMTHIFRLSMGGKGVVESRKRIPLCFDISPYSHCNEFTISTFHHSTI